MADRSELLDGRRGAVTAIVAARLAPEAALPGGADRDDICFNRGQLDRPGQPDGVTAPAASPEAAVAAQATGAPFTPALQAGGSSVRAAVAAWTSSSPSQRLPALSPGPAGSCFEGRALQRERGRLDAHERDAGPSSRSAFP